MLWRSRGDDFQHGHDLAATSHLAGQFCREHIRQGENVPEHARTGVEHLRQPTLAAAAARELEAARDPLLRAHAKAAHPGNLTGAHRGLEVREAVDAERLPQLLDLPGTETWYGEQLAQTTGCALPQLFVVVASA